MMLAATNSILRSPQRSVNAPEIAVKQVAPTEIALNTIPSCALLSANVATSIGESAPSAC